MDWRWSIGTDIISFDYSVGNELNGDIFVSVERVQDNATDFNVSFAEELLRVLAHGILHYCGYKDKSEEEAVSMRKKEDEKIAMFHVEHYFKIGFIKSFVSRGTICKA